MKQKSLILLSIIFFNILISCDDAEELKEMKFNVVGAKAILYSQEQNPSGRVATSVSNVFKIDDQGNVTSILDDVEITFIKTLSDGLFIVTNECRKFYVRLDNTFTEISENIGDYKGENLNGDLIFSDASILRKSTLQVEKIQTTLTSPRVQSLSQNFAIISDNSIYQIFNTVSGIRYNIAGCNGPRMIALNQSVALVDDCQNQIVFNMTNGNRSDGDISAWNHEAVTTSSGVVLLSQTLDGNSSGYQLGEINTSGNLSLLSTYEFAPGSGSCMNCGTPNTVLFNTGEFFVVRELNKVTVLKRGEQTPKSILDGYNVTSISLSNNQVYYLAENNLGSPITGIYNLLTDTNEIIESSLQFDNVQTFN